MKYFHILIILLIASFIQTPDASARLFTPKCQNGNNSASECSDKLNSYLDVDESLDIKGMTYSATWDAALDPRNLSIISIPACLYDRTKNPPELIINNFLMQDSAQVLLGIKNAKYCPLPGSTLFSDYPNAISGEFLISGVVCVVNSIIFDAMFKIYCTIILWFYNILFSMIIIYIMFYGLSIMIGIGNDPIKEAPKRILKIIIIFALAVNAQIGFRFVHNGFFTALNAFTNMLVDLQPYQDENGQPAYKKSAMSTALGADFLTNTGPLLDENGDKWRHLPDGQEYYDIFLYNYKKAIGQPVTLADVRKNLPSGMQYTAVDEVQPEDYVPFRVPAMQWTYKEVPKNSNQYKMYPVFQDLSQGQGTNWGNLEKDGYQFFQCILDLRWNALPMDEAGNILNPRLETYPRCQKNLWPTLPNVTPLGRYCSFVIVNDNGGIGIDLTGDGNVNSDDDKLLGKVLPSFTSSNSNEYCVDSDFAADSGILRFPRRLQRLTYSGTGITSTSLTRVCGPDNPQATALQKMEFWNCRKPFQGVLSKIDSMFGSVLGNDSGKTIGSLAIALALWATGSGLILSFFLLTGLTAMIAATMQLIWTYVTALMSLTFMLMLSPIFISFALFKVTENLFKGWLRACISYALQPFLVMAFIYMLSNISSLDRLSKLAHTEITNKVYMVDSGGQTQISLKAPSFTTALYEKPSDFDKWYYRNSSKETPTTSSSAQIFIDGNQREKYLKEKSDYIMNYWVAYKAGTSIDLEHIGAESDKLPGYTDLLLLRSIWYNGTWGNGPGQNTYRRGIKALDDFKWYYDPNNHPQNNASNPNPNANPAMLAKFQQLLDCWSAGCALNGPYQGINPSGVTASIDDNDAFLGEPESLALWGTNKGAEYPRCMKYCPQFKPAYKASDNTLNNPRMDAAQDHYPDGTKCPDIVDNQQPWIQTHDGNADICAPSADCTKYCMGVQQGQKSNYGYLFGAIIVWIILNIITAAFMTQVPKLAEALSRWDITSQANIVMGGASRKYDESGMDEWTQAEKSQMFHVGGLLDTGILSGNAGGVVALGDKMLRTATGQKEKVDDRTGEISRNGGYAPPTWLKTKEADAKRQAIKREEAKVEIYKYYKSKMGLQDNSRMTGDTPTHAFDTLRPNFKTGLPQRNIQEIIKRVTGAYPTANVPELKMMIDKQILELLDQTIETDKKKKQSGEAPPDVGR